MSSLYLEGMEFQELALQIKKIVRDCLIEAETQQNVSGLQGSQKIIPLTRDESLTLLTRNEVSKMLKVSLVTLSQWEKKRTLIPIRIGTRVRYKLSEIKKFIENRITSNQSSDEENKI